MRSQAKHTKHRMFSGPEKPVGGTGVALAFTLICLGLAALWPGALFHVLSGDDPSQYLIKISAILIAALFIPVLLLTKIPALTGRIPGRLILFGVFISFLGALLAGNVSPQIRAFQEDAFAPTFTPYLVKLKDSLLDNKAVYVRKQPGQAQKKLATNQPAKQNNTAQKNSDEQQIAIIRNIIEKLPLLKKRRYEEHLSKGDEYLTRYRFDAAIAEYDKAIQAFEKNSQAKSNRAEAIRRKRAFEESAEKTKKYNHHLAIGDAYLENKQYDLAIAAYNKASQIRPTGINAMTNRAKAIGLKSQYVMTLNNSNMTTQINPLDSKGYISRGLIHIAHSRYKLATADFTQAIRLNPKNAQAYESRAHSNFKNGHYDQAIADFSKAIELETSQGQ